MNHELKKKYKFKERNSKLLKKHPPCMFCTDEKFLRGFKGSPPEFQYHKGRKIYPRHMHCWDIKYSKSHNKSLNKGRMLNLNARARKKFMKGEVKNTPIYV